VITFSKKSNIDLTEFDSINEQLLSDGLKKLIDKIDMTWIPEELSSIGPGNSPAYCTLYTVAKLISSLRGCIRITI